MTAFYAEAQLMQQAKIELTPCFIDLVKIVGGWYFNTDLFVKTASKMMENTPDPTKGILLCGAVGQSKTFVFRVAHSILKLLKAKNFQMLDVWTLANKAKKSKGETDFLKDYNNKNIFVDDLGAETQIPYTSKEQPEFIGEHLLIEWSKKGNLQGCAIHGTTNYFTDIKGHLNNKYNPRACSRANKFFNIIQLDELHEKSIDIRGLKGQCDLDVWQGFHDNSESAWYVFNRIEELKNDNLHPVDFTAALQGLVNVYVDLKRSDRNFRLWHERRLIKKELEKLLTDFELLTDYETERINKKINLFGTVKNIVKSKSQEDGFISPTMKIAREMSLYIGIDISIKNPDLVHSFYSFYCQSYKNLKTVNKENRGLLMSYDEHKDMLKNKWVELNNVKTRKTKKVVNA